MHAGYLALTEMTAEKELFVYYGNSPCVELPFSGRFKLHLLPADITYVTLVAHDFIADTTETEAIVGLDEALKSGFMQPVELIGKNMNLKGLTPMKARAGKKKRK